MPYADLHVHTTRSDGTLKPEAVPEAARRGGVAVVACTDHDRLQSFDEPAIARAGVTILNGIELRVELRGENEPVGESDSSPMRVDLLGYGVQPTAELEALLAEIQVDRRTRGRAIVDCIEDRFGVDLAIDVGTGFGRPHVARAVDAHPDIPYDYQGAFDALIGAGGPCYVPRFVPTFDRGRRVLGDAAALVSLAHPLRYPDPERALARATELGAVEGPYPYDAGVDRTPLERFFDRSDVLVTGGSDAHNDRIGRTGLTEAAYRELGLPEPT